MIYLSGSDALSCNSNSDCNDGNVCTGDNCIQGECWYEDFNGVPCSDSNPCTVNDTCSVGYCSGTPINCNDNNICTDDVCFNGSCYHLNNTAPCSDGDKCTVNDTCFNGTCQGTLKTCDDGNECTADGCMSTTGLCIHGYVYLPCNDGVFCNGSDFCSSGSCSEHSGDPCTAGQSCNEATDTCEIIPTTSTTTIKSTSTTTIKSSTSTTTIGSSSTTTTVTLSTTTTLRPVPDCAVTINPESAQVFPLETLQFAAVTHCDEQLVTGTYLWYIDSPIGSIIDGDGVYRAGALFGTDTVTVRDVANGDINATATVACSLLWPMAYDEMWGEKQYENLLLLRALRDGVLQNTPMGKEYISLLYDNSLEVALLLIQHPLLADHTREVIDMLLPYIESLLNHNEIEVNQDTIDTLESLLNDFEAHASPNLKAAIVKAKKDIHSGEIYKGLRIAVVK